MVLEPWEIPLLSFFKHGHDTNVCVCMRTHTHSLGFFQRKNQAKTKGCRMPC